MIWDAQQRRYEDDQGRPIPPIKIRKEIDSWIRLEQSEVEREAGKLLAGAITLAAFFTYMREKIAAWHAIAGTIAYGGQEQMNPERWARINEKVSSEIEYLNDFQKEAEASFKAVENIAERVARSVDVPTGLESVIEERVKEALVDAAPSTALPIATAAVLNVLADSIGKEAAQAVTLPAIEADSLIGGTIASRAAQYPNAAYSTLENNVAAREWEVGAIGVRRVCEEDDASCEECVALATDEYVGFDEIMDIGDAACLHNCRCTLEFSYPTAVGFYEPITIERELYT